MTPSSIQHITLAAGETREFVFINEPNTHWHIVRAAIHAVTESDMTEWLN